MKSEEVKILPVLGGTGAVPAQGARPTRCRGAGTLGAPTGDQTKCLQLLHPRHPPLEGAAGSPSGTEQGEHRPLPTWITGRAVSSGPSLPSLGRQRNQQIPDLQQGSQRELQHKPSGKCTYRLENGGALSLRNFTSKPAWRNNQNGVGVEGSACPDVYHRDAKGLGRHTPDRQWFKSPRGSQRPVSALSAL